MPSARRAWHTDVFYRQSEARCAPCGSQAEHTNLLVPVLSEAPARSTRREQRSRCLLSPPGSISEFGNRDRRVDASHPIPSHPHLICGTGAEVASGSVLKTGADGQKCNLSQKKRFGDFFCGVKGLRRFIPSVARGYICLFLFFTIPVRCDCASSYTHRSL